MTNEHQQALIDLCKNCERTIAEVPTSEHLDSIEIHSCGHQMCPFRVIDNSYCDEFIKVKKALDDYDTREYEEYNDLMKDFRELERAFEILSIDYFNSQGGFFFENMKSMQKAYMEKAKESEKCTQSTV